MPAIDANGSNELIRFLYEVKKRPPLFLENKSLKELSKIIMGFTFGYNSAFHYDILEYHNMVKDGTNYSRFINYFTHKYNTSGPDYVELIKHCQSEEKAFDLFFEELEAFLIENRVEIPVIM